MVMRFVLILAVLVLPPLVLRALGLPLNGSVLGMPYDFRTPTPTRLKQAAWNPQNDHMLTPHIYGWGYALNLHAVGRRLGLVNG
jgi:hypothetical protein